MNLYTLRVHLLNSPSIIFIEVKAKSIFDAGTWVGITMKRTGEIAGKLRDTQAMAHIPAKQVQYFVVEDERPMP